MRNELWEVGLSECLIVALTLLCGAVAVMSAVNSAWGSGQFWLAVALLLQNGTVLLSRFQLVRERRRLARALGDKRIADVGHARLSPQAKG